MLFSSGQASKLGKARGSRRPLNGDIMLYVLEQGACVSARLEPEVVNLLIFRIELDVAESEPMRSYSLQNPLRERETSSRPRNFLPEPPPNARKRHFALYKHKITFK